MAWTVPATAVAGQVFTATMFNTYVRDNLSATAVGQASSAGKFFVTLGASSVVERDAAVTFITTSQATGSLTYVDLATVGPTVSAWAEKKALVFVGAQMSNSTAGQSCRCAITMSGATTAAPSDVNAYMITSGNANDAYQGTWVTIHDPITPGFTNFKLQYRVSGGTGTFSNRLAGVVPF